PPPRRSHRRPPTSPVSRSRSRSRRHQRSRGSDRGDWGNWGAWGNWGMGPSDMDGSYGNEPSTDGSYGNESSTDARDRSQSDADWDVPNYKPWSEAMRKPHRRTVRCKLPGPIHGSTFPYRTRYVARH